LIQEFEISEQTLAEVSKDINAIGDSEYELELDLSIVDVASNDHQNTSSTNAPSNGTNANNFPKPNHSIPKINDGKLNGLLDTFTDNVDNIQASFGISKEKQEEKPTQVSRKDKVNSTETITQVSPLLAPVNTQMIASSPRDQSPSVSPRGHEQSSWQRSDTKPTPPKPTTAPPTGPVTPVPLSDEATFVL